MGNDSTVHDESKTTIVAQRAVLIAQTNQLASGQRLEEVLFHGPKEMNVRVDVGKDSTIHGELLPAPWDMNGKISEQYLMKGGKFEEHSLKQSGVKSEFETVKVLKDSKKLGTYIENLTESDQELKQLHALHIPAESKSIGFDSILQSMGSHDSCQETLVKKVACKALINAPATGYDIVGDLVVAVTRIKSDAGPGGYQRRVHFFHVRFTLNSCLQSKLGHGADFLPHDFCRLLSTNLCPGCGPRKRTTEQDIAAPQFQPAARL